MCATIAQGQAKNASRIAKSARWHQARRRKMAAEGAACALLALDLQPGTVSLQHMLDDGKAEARAAAGAAPAGIDPIESLGEARDVRGGDADSGVTHGEMATLLVAPPAHRDGAVGGRIFGGVLQQVAEGRMQLRLSTEQPIAALHKNLHVPRAAEPRQQIAAQAGE